MFSEADIERLGKAAYIAKKVQIVPGYNGKWNDAKWEVVIGSFDHSLFTGTFEECQSFAYKFVGKEIVKEFENDFT